MRYEITITATNDDGTVTDGDRSVFTFPGSIEDTEKLYRNTVAVSIQELMNRVFKRFPERVAEYEESLKRFKENQSRALLAAKKEGEAKEKDDEKSASGEDDKAESGAVREKAAARGGKQEKNTDTGDK